MTIVHILVFLLLCAIALGWLARRWQIPYPIALVLGGTALGFAPELPPLEFDPQLILLIVLPPVLYQAALLTSWRDFRRNLKPISLLSVGLVIATTVTVAITAHWLIPGLPWAAAFALGAIISPPDAVATTAILDRSKVSQRIISILEGESLVNDATGLVLYKFAVAAALTGVFSLAQASVEFVFIAMGGIFIGIILGRLFVAIHGYLNDSLIETMLSIALPYTAYILAESLHASGVLAVVAAGLLRARYAPEVFSPQSRMLTRSVWNMIVFLLNSLVFILIGLQLSSIVAGLTEYRSLQLLGYAVVISAITIASRIIWVFPSAYLPHLLSKNSPAPSWQETSVISWCGMRGIVSLVAALALPYFTLEGLPFPSRDLIVFLTFSVIITTLVLQGLTLPHLIRLLKIGGDWDLYHEEQEARSKLIKVALEEIEKTALEADIPTETLEHVRWEYKARLQELEPTSLILGDIPHVRQLRLAAVAAERRELIKLWRNQEINDDVLQRIQRDLDFDESRLMKD